MCVPLGEKVGRSQGAGSAARGTRVALLVRLKWVGECLNWSRGRKREKKGKGRLARPVGCCAGWWPRQWTVCTDKTAIWSTTFAHFISGTSSLAERARFVALANVAKRQTLAATSHHRPAANSIGRHFHELAGHTRVFVCVLQTSLANGFW